MKIRKFNFVGNPSQSPFKKGRGFRSPPLEKGVPKAGDFIFEGNLTVKEINIWFDPEGDYLEVLFDRKAGFFRETDNDAMMESG